MRILIVEDNEKLARSVQKGLEQKGFVVDHLSDGLAGYHRLAASEHSYDGVILDLMLPGKDGMSICRDLRRDNNQVPILMLTAKDTTAERVLGLEEGADDYLVKPFSFEELVARLNAVLRRPRTIVEQKLSASGIVLNATTHELSVKGKLVSVSQKEFTILEYLMRNPNRVISRQEILDHAWEFEFNPFSNLVDVKIKNLRKKVDPDATIIETVRGSGYRFHAF